MEIRGYISLIDFLVPGILVGTEPSYEWRSCDCQTRHLRVPFPGRDHRVLFVYDSRWEAKVISRVYAQTSQGPTKLNRHCRPTSCWGDLKGLGSRSVCETVTLYQSIDAYTECS